MGLCLLFVAQIGDTVGEISDGVCGPLVNVLLHGLEVIPQGYTVAQPFCVGLYSLGDLKEQSQAVYLSTEQNKSQSTGEVGSLSPFVFSFLSPSLCNEGRYALLGDGRKTRLNWFDRCGDEK